MTATTENGPGEILAIFRYTLVPGADTTELATLWLGLYELVTNTAAFGFVGHDHCETADGTQIVMYRFATDETMRKFIVHPQHRAIQARGGEFFATLSTHICRITRESEFAPS